MDDILLTSKRIMDIELNTVFYRRYTPALSGVEEVSEMARLPQTIDQIQESSLAFYRTARAGDISDTTQSEGYVDYQNWRRYLKSTSGPARLAPTYNTIDRGFVTLCLFDRTFFKTRQGYIGLGP